MKARHFAAVALASVVVSAHALPALTSNLGTNPSNAPVLGVVFSGTATTNYYFDLTQQSKIIGSLVGLGATMNSITLSGGTLSTPVLASAPDSGSFSFLGLGIGSYTLAFNFSAPSFGAFSGGVSAVPAAVPEPEVYGLALAGVALVCARRQRRIKANML
jgi:hypothetical protein